MVREHRSEGDRGLESIYKKLKSTFKDGFEVKVGPGLQFCIGGDRGHSYDMWKIQMRTDDYSSQYVNE